MSLKSATNFTGGASRASLAQQLAADPALTAWFGSRATELTLEGSAVAQVVDRAGGDLTLAGNSTFRPTLANAQFGAVAGLLFDGTDDVLYMPDDFDRDGPFSIAMVVKATQGAICSSFTGAAEQTTLIVDAPNARIGFNHGVGYATAPYTPGAAVLLIASSAGFRIAIRAGGQQSLNAASDNNGGAATFCVGALNGLAGAPMDGVIAEFWLFQAELLSPDAANTLEALRAYVRAIYPAVAV